MHVQYDLIKGLYPLTFVDCETRYFFIELSYMYTLISVYDPTNQFVFSI